MKVTQKNYLIKVPMVVKFSPEQIIDAYVNPRGLVGIWPHDNPKYCLAAISGVQFIFAMTPLDAYEKFAPHMAIEQKTQNDDEEDDGN